MTKIARRVVSLGVALVVAVGLGVTPAAAAAAALRGSLDNVTVTPDGVIRVTGWAFAANGSSAAVHVYDTGPTRTVGTNLGNAQLPRSDVGAVFGRSHTGFDRPLAMAEQGAHRVCVYAVGDNFSSGAVLLLGCRDVWTGRAPVGSIDVVPRRSVEGDPIQVRGWAYDPDQPQTPLQIHAYVSVGSSLTRGTQLVTGTINRPDVAAVYPGVGSSQGFDSSLSLVQYLVDGYRAGQAWYQGINTVCLFAIGVGLGGNTLLGCRDVNVQPKVNSGLDPITSPTLGAMSIRGWSYIVNSPGETTQNAASVMRIGDPQSRSVSLEFPADQPRPDVDRAFPGAGSKHGYVTSTRASPGRYSVCVSTRSYTGPPVVSDQFSRQECREAEIVNALGVVDSVVVGEAGPGTATVRGWGIDPIHPTASFNVQVAVNSGLEPDWIMSNHQPQPMTVDRPDVNAAFGVTGMHGYEIVISVPEDFFVGGGQACATAEAFAASQADCSESFGSKLVPVG